MRTTYPEHCDTRFEQNLVNINVRYEVFQSVFLTSRKPYFSPYTKKRSLLVQGLVECV